MPKNNVIIKDKNTVYIDKRAKIGENVIIYENNRIEGNCEIGDNVTIFPNSFVHDSVIGKGSKIYSSRIENSKVGSCVFVGPYSHIRSKSCICDFVKISSFCELKNATIGKRTRLNNLVIVQNAKIGCDCKIKNMVSIGEFQKNQVACVGDNVEIGQKVAIVLPVVIESGAKIEAGTIVNKDILMN